MAFTNGYRKSIQYNISAGAWTYFQESYAALNGGYLGAPGNGNNYVSVYKVTFEKAVTDFTFRITRNSTNTSNDSTVYIKILAAENDATYGIPSNIISDADASFTVSKTQYSIGSVTVSGDFAAGTWYIYCAASKIVQSLDNSTVSGVTYTSGVVAATERSGLVYIDNGSSWDAYEVYIDDGTSWAQCVPYVDDGSDWVMCS